MINALNAIKKIKKRSKKKKTFRLVDVTMMRWPYCNKVATDKEIRMLVYALTHENHCFELCATKYT